MGWKVSDVSVTVLAIIMIVVGVVAGLVLLLTSGRSPYFKHLHPDRPPDRPVPPPD